MYSTSDQPRGLSFDSANVGVPQPWAVTCRRVEYAGEVIIAETLNPEWLLPLEGGLDFRVVLFTVPRRMRHRTVAHPRTALAVPTRVPGQADQLGTELKAIREASARYVTGGERGGGELRDAMAAREQSLRGELASRYTAAYARGRVYTHPEVEVRPADIFQGELPASWVDRLASELLVSACPELPFDDTMLPETLTPERVARVFKGLLQGEEAELALAFGPALALTRPEATGFDPEGSQVVEIVADLLGAADGHLPVVEVVSELGSRHGIPRALAALYLMAFVRHARAELELGATHSVRSIRGGRFPADRITWDLVPEVAFSETLVDHSGWLRLDSKPTWNTVLPYATLLHPDLPATDGTAPAADQEAVLLELLAKLDRQVAKLRVMNDELEAALGAPAAEASQVLDGLSALCDAIGYQEFHLICQQRYGGPANLKDALALKDRLEQLAPAVTAIGDARQYLSGIAFGAEDGGLQLEHCAVSARIELTSLLENPSLWPSIERGLGEFRSKYSTLYLAHHTRYYEQEQEISRRLERLTPQVDALARFNEMPELGEPIGVDAQERLQVVVGSIKSCSTAADRIWLETSPRCQKCSLGLDEEVPRREADAAMDGVEMAMREYSRVLGSHGARMVLANPTSAQLTKFVELVQVADPSALADVLNDDVVEFLRQFLTSH